MKLHYIVLFYLLGLCPFYAPAQTGPSPRPRVRNDSYYKSSRDLIDEGQFGSALIFTPFNYAKGNQYGAEITANYTLGGFNAYANFGFERGTGTQIASSQFLFGPDELTFIRNHWVFLDHDQRYTVSAGASYSYKGTTVSCTE